MGKGKWLMLVLTTNFHFVLYHTVWHLSTKHHLLHTCTINDKCSFFSRHRHFGCTIRNMLYIQPVTHTTSIAIYRLHRLFGSLDLVVSVQSLDFVDTTRTTMNWQYSLGFLALCCKPDIEPHVNFPDKQTQFCSVFKHKWLPLLLERPYIEWRIKKSRDTFSFAGFNVAWLPFHLMRLLELLDTHNWVL